jgi:hypothetical protein
MSPIAAGDLLLTQRAGVQYKSEAEALKTVPQPTDLFLVQRGASLFHVPYSRLDQVDDADLLLVQRGVTQYKATGAELKAWLGVVPEQEPWTPADLPGLMHWYEFDDASKVTVVGISITQIDDSRPDRTPAVMTAGSQQFTFIAEGEAGGGMPSHAFAPHSTNPAPAPMGLVNPIFHPAPTHLFACATSVNGSGAGQPEILVATPSNNVLKAISWAQPNRQFTGFLNGTFGFFQNYGENLHAIWSNPAEGNPGPIMIGGWDGGFGTAELRNCAPANARIYEIIVAPQSTTDADRQRIEGYLAWKPSNAVLGLIGALPADHPYKNAPPTKQPSPPPVDGPWTPADMDLVYWFDASQLGTISMVAQSRVSGWVSAVGVGPVARQTNATMQPWLLQMETPPYSWLVWADNSHRFGLSGVPHFPPIEAGDMFVIAIAGDCPNFMSGPTRALSIRFVGEDSALYGQNQLTQTFVDLQTTNSSVYIFETNGRNASLLAINGDIALGDHGQPFSAPSMLFEGDQGQGSGGLFEFFLARGPFRPGDRERVQGYLAHKLGLVGQLPADHPYKDSPPMKS